MKKMELFRSTAEMDSLTTSLRLSWCARCLCSGIRMQLSYVVIVDLEYVAKCVNSENLLSAIADVMGTMRYSHWPFVLFRFH